MNEVIETRSTSIFPIWDLVLIMESHHYRAEKGAGPQRTESLLGLELTAGRL